MTRTEIDNHVLAMSESAILPAFDSGAMAACLLAELESNSGISGDTFAVLIGIAAQLAKHSKDGVVSNLTRHK